jgi:hypothetical protein
MPSHGDFVRLEYRGRMPKVVLNALKKRYDVKEQQALGDVGENVLVLEVQRWGDKLTVHICVRQKRYTLFGSLPYVRQSLS